MNTEIKSAEEFFKKYLFIQDENVNGIAIDFAKAVKIAEMFADQTRIDSTEIKSAEEIFNKHSWRALGSISPSKFFCIDAMNEYAAQFTIPINAEDEKVVTIVRNVAVKPMSHDAKKGDIVEIRDKIYEFLYWDHDEVIGLKDMQTGENIEMNWW